MWHRNITFLLIVITLAVFNSGFAQEQMQTCKEQAIQWVDDNEQIINAASQAVWKFAETGLVEQKSADYLADMLEKDGFNIERAVADMPSAFIATYGKGEPVIGILAEYDALPGLSQKAAAAMQEVAEAGAPGHGCGHNLLGAGACATAMAMKSVMQKNNIKGTVKLYGCPAEETVVGKVYMAKRGLFDDLDVCLNWHPSSKNEVKLDVSRAMNSFEVTFRGKTAHGSADPWNGRSALDAVELMNAGVNYMREHLKDAVRIHYVIKDGGKAPNIVPEYATVWYFVRDINRQEVEKTYKRVLDCARGAALMTETEMELKLITGVYSYLPNYILSEVVHKNLQQIGTPKFSKEQQSFAKKMQKNLGIEQSGFKTDMEPLEITNKVSGGSTDVADISWIVPTSGMLFLVTSPEGIPSHSWAVVSASGSSVGLRGMHTAAKIMAASGMEILLDQSIIEKAREEFKEKTKGFVYKSAVPKKQKPPLTTE